MNKRCIAYMSTCGLQIRKSSSGDGSATAFGVAVPYEQYSTPIYGYFKEKFKRGAFTECLSDKPDIVCSIDHNWTNILGRVSANNVRIEDRDSGLYVECDLNNTTYARDLVENLRVGNVKGMSFTFDSLTDIWGREDGMAVRTVEKAKLYEVCFTSNPAYIQTTAGARSINVFTPEDVEAWVKEKLGERKAPEGTSTIVTDEMRSRYERMKRFATEK